MSSRFVPNFCFRNVWFWFFLLPNYRIRTIKLLVLLFIVQNSRGVWNKSHIRIIMLTRIKSTKSISSRIRQFSTVSNRTSRATQFRFSTSFSTTAVDSVLHRRNDFRYTLPIQTRWKDNDQYGHVNNVVYYSYFDTAVRKISQHV